MVLTNRFWIGIFLLQIYLFSSFAFAEQLVGVTDFSKRINLMFNDSGVIEKVHIVQGQIVSQGQILISLDSKILASKVTKSESMLKAYEPVLQQKLTELDKANELYDRDSLARVDLENAEHEHIIAKAHYEAAKADLEIAKLKLESTQLLAPIDGLIVGLNANSGEVVDSVNFYRPLVELVDHKKMIAITQVSSEIWHRNINNKFAKITYRGKEYSGAVVYVGQERIEKTSAIPGFEVRVLFSTKGDIPANMPVTIEIQE